ncbi:MFS transporter [Pediococcus acidilactici]|uniref:MFS transporter n=2 Tax=Pediococcus acidilactici TaxID=1254 RepID=UPI003EBBB4BB
MSVKIMPKIKKYYPGLIILLVGLLFVSPQILNKSIIFGADVPFHFNRVYDVYMQLKTHNFNFFQMDYGFNQSGRIINALYGPGFAYFLGLILFFVRSWLKFQVVTSFAIFVISGYLMYKLATKLGVEKKFATIAAVIFMSSYWIQSWVTVESFMAWGTMLMPLEIMVGIDMIKFDPRKFSAVKLALVVALVIQVHVLSALFTVVAFLIFFVIGLVKTKERIKLFWKTVEAGILCLVLTFNVWGAMLEVFSTNNIVTPFPVANMSKETVNLSVGNTSIYELGLVVSIIYLVQIGYVLYKWKVVDFTNKVVTLIGGMFLLLASNVVPWRTIGTYFGKIESLLQFPYRFLTIASVLLIAGFAMSLSEMKHSPKSSFVPVELAAIIGAVFIAMGTFNGIQNAALVWYSNWPISTKTPIIKTKQFTAAEFRNEMKSADLKRGLKLVTKGYPDYLPTSSKNLFANNNPYGIYAEEIIFNQKGFHKSVKGNTLTVRWHSNKNAKKTMVPVTVYKNSQVSLNGTKLNNDAIKLTKIGTPVISSRKGKNELRLAYKSSLISKYSLWLVAVAWVLCIIFVLVI